MAYDLISNHDPTIPLFLYVALQNIHTPLESPDYYFDQYSGTSFNRKRKRTSGMNNISVK